MLKMMEDLELIDTPLIEEINGGDMLILFKGEPEQQDLIYSIMRKEDFNLNNLITSSTPKIAKWTDTEGRTFKIAFGEDIIPNQPNSTPDDGKIDKGDEAGALKPVIESSILKSESVVAPNKSKSIIVPSE